MKRKQLFIAVVLLATIILHTACSAFPRVDRTPANIVFILVDDMRYDEAQFMPNLQELVAAQGVTFSNFFVNVPNCCPSRASILLGQYSANTRILTNSGAYGGANTFQRLGRQDKVFPLWLQSVGYHTGYAGRYLNGFQRSSNIPPGWDDWSLGNSAQTGQIILDQIQNAIDENKPFFIHYAPFAPHYLLSDDGQKLPPAVQPQYSNLFLDQPLPSSPSFNEQDLSDKPSQFQSLDKISSEEEAKILDHYQKRLQALQSVDEIIGSIIAFLEENDKLDNTYIIFTSDNGFQLGEHRIVLNKHVAYEESIHMPFLLRGPGVAKGKIIGALAGNIDIAPTIAEIAGVNVPEDVDGVSLLSIIKGKNTKCRDAYLIQYWLHSERNSWPALGFNLNKLSNTIIDPTIDLELIDSSIFYHSFRGIRTLDFKYVEYVTGEKELYLLHKDPYELENRINDASPELLLILTKWVDQLSRCTGVTCRDAEKAPQEFDVSMLPE